MEWTELLARAGIPEPPGRPELVALIQQERVEAGAGELAVQPVKRKRRRGKH